MSEAILDAVAKGLRFIEENLYQEIGVNDVAKAAAYSPFYFSRVFSRHAHISVYDYILKRKLSPILQGICTAGGTKSWSLPSGTAFSRTRYIPRAFRKLFGENPSEASVYKPMAVYEPISQAYLMFLSGLRMEAGDHCASELCFEVSGAGARAGGREFAGLSDRACA